VIINKFTLYDIIIIINYKLTRILDNENQVNEYFDESFQPMLNLSEKNEMDDTLSDKDCDKDDNEFFFYKNCFSNSDENSESTDDETKLSENESENFSITGIIIKY
jgi:hypothetical protein